MTRLNNCALQKIPLSIYESNGNDQLTECPICLFEFTDGEKVRVLPSCNHSFHVQCIDMWLSSHSSCPICRHSLLDRSEVPTCILVGEQMSEVDGSPFVAAEVDEV
ncbi:RING-H2 finger protein ATL72-like [Dendrobium catenatum]|uniref:RING-H2 finger protein ATL72 n=1 Tax=Dendrobium catenatum TaxID=906689 RepID=A0A2I0X5Z1_9ASPA|nr:RING-H2 finger protein ATL72-like [Dendrobium catenatum]PKU83348.1 RING-H2 finger protein ATL72 [Dendrobium catenatum]